MADAGNDATNQGGSPEPFRESGSGADYDPAASWGAERRTDAPSGGTVNGMQGAPSGAGDGGYGPEGDYVGAAGTPNADVLGQVNGSDQALVDEAQHLGHPRPGRMFVGGNPPDAGEPPSGSAS